MRAHTHACTQRETHACRHAHTCTRNVRTHTHTHTHTPLLFSSHNGEAKKVLPGKGKWEAQALLFLSPLRGPVVLCSCQGSLHSMILCLGFVPIASLQFVLTLDNTCSNLPWDSECGFLAHCVCAKWLQLCSTLCDPMDSRQECWRGLLCTPPGDLLDPWIEPKSLTSNLHWQVDSLPLAPPGEAHSLPTT